MQTWRLQTNTDGGDVAKFCLDKHVIAMGWQLDDHDREILLKNPSFENYCNLADKHYEGYNSIKRMVQQTAPNDIVWMKYDGQYYYARITKDSEWKFDFSSEAIALDATNQLTNIKWNLVDKSGDESSVPGCLSTGFIRGSTFQRINKSGINEYSQMLYNMNAAGEEGFRYDKPAISLNEKDFWNLLQPDDAEDLLCMWLYREKGYIVIPSTNKKGTELYECVLIDPKSEDHKHIYIQVKKGDVTIDASKYDKLNGEVYFLTTGGEVINANKSNYYVVPSKKIYDFAIDPQNRALIPEGIAYWIKFMTKSENENMDKASVKGIMIDTNLSFSDKNEIEMLSQSRVCAYGDADRYIRSFHKGDYALYYSKGKGVVAIGEVISEEPREVETEKGLYHEVKMIVPKDMDFSKVHDKFISAKEIKDLLNRGFYFASTIKTPFLCKEQVEKLKDALISKYEA
ncbi:EVE domain-containing protein [Oribacterium sp. FC2011]|uniref:EVE domain-containing protein n=1 Tax=Oribacterium sp. FC2011 TaxID=1408311 RepID=UPI0004E223F2|nr:EVE domain-containing protein [Oribacterium sp. FC2011]